MALNSSKNPPSIVPTLRYRDAEAAIQWLCRVLGFRKHFVVAEEGGLIAHAQLTFGNGMIMLGSAREDEFGSFQVPPEEGRPGTQSPYVIVKDIDTHYETARAEGGEIVIPLREEPHGGKFYAVRDPEGHLWNFGSYDPWSG